MLTTGYNADHRRDFDYTIEGRPDFAFLTVQIPANQTLKVEASAMATMDSNLQMKTKMRGGLSRLLTGESIFVNEFTAANVPGSIGIAPCLRTQLWSNRNSHEPTVLIGSTKFHARRFVALCLR